MKLFMDRDFLLSTPTAVTLFHDYAAGMPLVDYHCHIDPREIWENRQFENITQIWLGGDHYKWRIMRSGGVPEEYVTGNAPDREKFQKFAEVLPRCVGNPMYHWCHLELKTYFGYDGVLNGQTAEDVWNLCNQKLQTMRARDFIKASNVAMIGTTDDPCSDLAYHALLADSDLGTKVCPSFRPDPALNMHKKGFVEYIAKLSAVTGMDIKSVADVKAALSARMDHFAAHGCRASDHGLDYIMYREASEEQINAALTTALAGGTVDMELVEAYQTALLIFCAGEYARRGWVMQLHFSCMRNPNSRRFAELGPDTGFDSIAVTNSCAPLYRLMDALDKDNALPRTVLYSLNPADNQWIDTLLGAFQDSSIPGKLQHGSAWWFNDNKVGMQDQLTSLANLSILGNFIGMLTDSRSFLSYTRHEYFRRILCNLIGNWIENGEYPCDIPTAGALVQDICYYNAARYFNL